MQKKLRLLVIMLVLSVSSYAQNVRGIYISGISGWLGNTTKENDILDYVKGNGYNYITLYSLSSINWHGNGHKKKLADFIKKAKTQYNVTQVGAVVETFEFMNDNIIPYNNSRSNPIEKFDVINQEFEFWIIASIMNQYAQAYLIPNGYSVDTAGAFKFGYKELQKIDSACASNGLISEIYLGWPTKGQMQKIASVADRILLHAYRPTDVDLYGYSKERLEDIASVGALKKVIAIFSAETVYMGPWLSNNPMTQPYSTYASDFSADTASYKQNVDLQGYQWFTYGWMPKSVAHNATITASGPLVFCPGGSVALTANQGDSYQWIPGGQTTRTITVSNPGSYKVKVTHSNGHTYQSAPTIVAYTSNPSAPSVTANGPIDFCNGSTVTLTATQATSYAWSNGATTQSITVGTSGQYHVTTNTGSCQETSTPVTVNVKSAPSSVISSNGPLSFCEDNTVRLTAVSADDYLWSNGETTRSIDVLNSGNYSVLLTGSNGCETQSQTKIVTVYPTPAKPVISASGATTLDYNHPAVLLSSSNAPSYTWSEGSSTQSITVAIAGAYKVLITDNHGCTATSDEVIINSERCDPPNLPQISLDASPVIVDDNGVELTSSEGGGYLWSTGETTRSITVHQEGEYSVRVYCGPDCFSNSLPVRISDSTKSTLVMNGKTLVTINAFPNPATESITIDYTSLVANTSTVVIYELSGKEIYREENATTEGSNKLRIDVSQLPRGIYLAGIMNGDDKNMTRIVLN